MTEMESLKALLSLKKIEEVKGAGGSSKNPVALLIVDGDGSKYTIEDKKVIDLLLKYPGANPEETDKILNALKKTIQKARKDKKKVDKAKQVNGTTNKK